MAYTDYLELVQKFYIGYYQRPADPGGLIYWASRVDARGGDYSVMIEAFANSAESTALYGEITSENISDVVNSIYNALFNRDAEEEGLDYYVDGFNAGTFTAATIMIDVLNGAQNEDLATVNNKVTAAELFTTTIDPELDGRDYQATYSGDDDAANGRIFLSGGTIDSVTYNPVTWVASSIPIQSETTAYIQENIADEGDPIGTTPSGETYTLTTGTDNFTGGAYADYFDASLSSGGKQTLGTNDNITGGSGNDSLYAEIINAATVTPTISGIETLEFNGQAAGTVSLVNASGYTTLKMTGNSANFTVDRIAAATTALGVSSNMTGTTATFKFTDDALSGSSDNVALTIDGSAGTIAIDDQGGANKAETVTITASGGSSTLTDFQTDNVGTSKLVINASAALNLGSGLHKSVTTIDASGSTADVTAITGAATSVIAVTGGAGNDSFTLSGTAGHSVTAGAGNDTLTIDEGSLSSATIAGGDGSDTVKTTAAAAYTVADSDFTNVTSVETLAAGGTTGSDDMTVALSKYALAAGIVNVTDVNDVDAALIVSADTNYNGKTLTVTLDDQADTNFDDISVSGTTATLIVQGDADGFDGSDTITGGSGNDDTIKLTASGTGAVNNLTGIEKITVTATSGDVTFTTTDTSVVTAAAKNLVVDASAMGSSQVFTFTADSLTDHLYATGGAGNDVITSGTGNDSLSGGAGNDKFAFDSADFTYADTVVGGDGTDTISIDDAAAIVDADFTKVSGVETLDISAAGSSSVVLDSYAKTAGITSVKGYSGGADVITATSGYTGTLTVTNLGTGNDKVTVEGSTVLKVAITETGLAAADTLTGGSGTSDRITITPDGGSTTLGANITGFEEIVIASDAAAMSLTLADDNVASGATLTIDGSAMTANTLTVDGSAETNGHLVITGGGAADSITAGQGNDSVDGGAGDDQITIASAYFTSADTVTGGSGTDTLLMTGTTAVVDADFTKVTGVENFTLGAGGSVTASTSARVAGITKITTVAGNETVTVGSGYGTLDSLTVVLSTGNDTVSGGSSAATITISADADDIDASDSITGGTGSGDTLKLTAGTLTSAESLYVTGFEKLTTSGDTANFSITLNDAVNSTTTFTVDASSLASGTYAITFDGSNEDDGTFKVTGGAGSDYITGSSNSDIIAGGAGDDTISGGSGDDTMTGGSGNDTITVAQADDFADGESGTNDTLNLTSIGSGTFVVDLSASGDQLATFNGSANKTIQTGFENLTASSINGKATVTANPGGSTITTGSAADTITGGVGNDSITGGSGADSIVSGGGIDTLVGGGGNDTYAVSVSATSFGGNFTLNEAASGGTDTLVVTGTVTSAITIDASGTTNAFLSDGDFTAGNTLEIFDFTGLSGKGVILTTGAGDAAPTVYGSEQADTVTGGSSADTISTAGGADSIDGGAAADTISGGEGDDTIVGGAGADSLSGGTGSDIIRVDTAAHLASNETIIGGDGTDTLYLNVTACDLTNIDGSYDNLVTEASIERLLVKAGTSQTLDEAITGTALSINSDATAATEAFTITMTGTTLDLGSLDFTAVGTGSALTSADTFAITGSGSADTITVAGTVTNTVTAGNGIDNITLGSGADLVLLTSDSTSNRDVITGFTIAADQIGFDESAFASINFPSGAGTGSPGTLAAGDYNEAAAAALTLTANKVNVITDAAGFASYAVAFAAVTAGGAGDDVFVVFYNSVTSKTEIYWDNDASNDTGVLIAQIDITGVNVASLSEANFYAF